MSATIDKGEAVRLLQGLEAGGSATADARIIAETLDPVLIHFILKYLRESYPAPNPAATAVLDRVIKLTWPSGAKVDRVEVKWMPDEGEFDRITIVPSS